MTASENLDSAICWTTHYSGGKHWEAQSWTGGAPPPRWRIVTYSLHYQHVLQWGGRTHVQNMGFDRKAKRKCPL
jgi:hypothetical protein